MSGAEISSGKVVSFHYDLYNKDSQKIESSAGGEPMRFLFGEHSVLAALQDAFLGKQPGDDFSVTIPHEKAYGRYYPNRVQRVSRKSVDGGKRKSFRVGEIVHVPGPNGSQPATVVKAGKFNLDLDSNHPLAGQDLTFDVNIITVQDASDEELAHGHAHGPGAHARH